MSAPGERILGSYRLLEQIGKGGMGNVYRAQHLRLGREAAVKVLPAHLADEADFLMRFEREASSVASLNHPNILPVWDYGEQDGAPYLVMPLIRAGTLKDRLARGALSQQEAVKYLEQMADALDYAHERGIIHRDVKPANMLLDERGRLYLADFGIAKALEGGAGLTRTGVGVGTPEYMAPEQAQGHADTRSDLYALGVVLYQMLTGRVPYSGNSTVEVLMRHMQEPPPLLPLRNVTPALSPGVEGVIQKALAKNPNERYQTGRALVDAFQEALARRAPISPPPPPVGMPQGWQQPAGDPTVVAGGTPPPPGWGPPATPPPAGWPQPAPSTPPPAYTPPPPPATTPAARGRGRAPLLAGGIAGLIALLLLCAGGGYLAFGRGGAAPTATTGAAATGTAGPTSTAPGAALASPTAGTVAGSPAAGTTATTVRLAGGSASSPYPTGGKYSTLEPVGKRGGQMTEFAFTEAVTLNAMVANDTPSGERIAMMFNLLVEPNPDNGLPYAVLASDVPTLANGGISADGLTYTFNLRRDVKWHDGRPFTSRDVVYTYTTMLKPELGSARTAELAERIDSVTAPNEFTVVFKLKKVVSSFLTANMYAIVPEHILRDVPVGQLKTHPFSTGDPGATIGTGPFKLQEWVKGEQMTLVKNPNYFLGDPALDRYVFRMAQDTDWPEQLKAGEVDFSSVDAELYDQMSREAGLTTLTFDTYGVHLFAYQLDPAKTTLFQDQRVRQALAYAVDRDAIVRQAFSNLATVAQGTMPILSWAYAPEQLKTKYTYDPRRAEQLLDEAGWRKGADGIRAKDGQRLSFSLTHLGDNVAGLLQEQWQAIGVEARLEVEGFDAYLTRLTETHDFELILVNFTFSIDPDQTLMWSTGAYPNGFNFGKYSNPRVDELLAQGLAEFDQEQRKQLYAEMQNIIMDELPAFIMLFPQDIVAVNKRVHNLRPNGVNTRWNVHTWWVE